MTGRVSDTDLWAAIHGLWGRYIGGFVPQTRLLVIKTNFLVVGFPEKGAACLEHRFSPQCGWTCFRRVCVLCYYEAIRDPLPSAFTLIGAVRLHSHVHQHKQPRSALRVFLIARASALANAAGAACCTCTLARQVPACIRSMCHG